MLWIRRPAEPTLAGLSSPLYVTSLSTFHQISRLSRSSRRAGNGIRTARELRSPCARTSSSTTVRRFDAEAVKFNIERMKTMPDSKRKAELAPVSGVEALAADKVRFTLSEQFVPLLANLSDRAGMIVSPKAAKEKGADFGAAPVCAGPYEFVERKSRDLIRVKKFADYWNAGQIGYDEVVYYYIADFTVRLSRVRAGDLDIAERIAPTDLKTVREDSNLALHSAPGLAVSHFMFNVGNGAKADTPLGRDANCVRRSNYRSIAT